jgi:hypothetical protein
VRLDGLGSMIGLFWNIPVLLGGGLGLELRGTVRRILPGILAVERAERERVTTETRVRDNSGLNTGMVVRTTRQA